MIGYEVYSFIFIISFTKSMDLWPLSGSGHSSASVRGLSVLSKIYSTFSTDQVSIPMFKKPYSIGKDGIGF
jgi:hypothetical protein